MKTEINKNFTLLNGDSLELLKKCPDNTFDSVVTDPPYGLGFMGKEWDKPENIAFNPEFWTEVLRVLKPGGHLLAFSGSRTYHRMAVAIEDAGFEIRDQLMWLYGSGFPKGSDLGKTISKSKTIDGDGEEWKGWNSALKPAHEPIVMARKPFSGTLANNVTQYGVGAINIDESRVPFMNGDQTSIAGREHVRGGNKNTPLGAVPTITVQNDLGRFPANVIHDGSDEVINAFPSTKKGGSITKETYEIKNQVYGQGWGNAQLHQSYGDSGSAARFFYGSKCSKTDRSEGLDINQINTGDLKGGKVLEAYRNQADKNDNLLVNNHPTVKPTNLIFYLVRLVTPKGGKVLDPFNGSGSTGKAIAILNKTENKDYSYIGIELDPYYVEISKARIEYALENETWLEKNK